MSKHKALSRCYLWLADIWDGLKEVGPTILLCLGFSVWVVAILFLIT